MKVTREPWAKPSITSNQAIQLSKSPRRVTGGRMAVYNPGLYQTINVYKKKQGQYDSLETPLSV